MNAMVGNKCIYAKKAPENMYETTATEKFPQGNKRSLS